MFFRKKNQETDLTLKKWQIILFLGIIVITFILGIRQNASHTEIEEPASSIILNRETCTDSGGDWNDCSSTCRGEGDVLCIQLCQKVCECESDKQCPFEYACRDIIDGKGVCKTGE